MMNGTEAGHWAADLWLTALLQHADAIPRGRRSPAADGERRQRLQREARLPSAETLRLLGRELRLRMTPAGEVTATVRSLATQTWRSGVTAPRRDTLQVAFAFLVSRGWLHEKKPASASLSLRAYVIGFPLLHRALAAGEALPSTTTAELIARGVVNKEGVDVRLLDTPTWRGRAVAATYLPRTAEELRLLLCGALIRIAQMETTGPVESVGEKEDHGGRL